LPCRKVVPLPIGGLAGRDSIEAWAGRYLDAARPWNPLGRGH
jgi:hypothetical protein